MAFFPFFMVMLWGSFISRFALHLTQYAMVAIVFRCNGLRQGQFKHIQPEMLLIPLH